MLKEQKTICMIFLLLEMRQWNIFWDEQFHQQAFIQLCKSCEQTCTHITCCTLDFCESNNQPQILPVSGCPHFRLHSTFRRCPFKPNVSQRIFLLYHFPTFSHIWTIFATLSYSAMCKGLRLLKTSPIQLNFQQKI